MRYRAKKFFAVAKNLIFVPTCASCGERLSPIPEKGNMTYDKVCFCKSCAEKWEMAKSEMCPSCYNVSQKCTCTPDFFFKYQPEIPSICFYHPDSDDVQSKAIISMKRRCDTELFEFMAIDLYPRLNSTLNKMGISGKDCIFTWVPRKASSIRESGFDQGKQLSDTLAKLFKTHSCPVFLRIGGKEQKKLDKSGRSTNAKRSIRLNTFLSGFPLKTTEKDIGEFLQGKNLVIVDDVLTSGSTLRQAVELARSAKLENTVVACIAKNYAKSNKEK